MLEFVTIVLCLAFNVTRLDDYIIKYDDVMASLSFINFLTIGVTIYAYTRSLVLFYFISGIPFVSVTITVALWIKDIRKEL
jgi:hypothetical protein